MSDGASEAVPEGFELLPVGYGFTDNLKPLYRKVEGRQVVFALRVGAQHSNTLGICHGGALMTLADIAAASWANMARGFVAGAPTINLSIDFISAAKQGQWIEAREEGVELKRLFGFVRGVVRSEGSVVARFNATFYFPDHPGMSQDGLVKPVALQGLLDD
jgi:uncharacterized protein (TIGR00369 family)